MVPLKVRMSLTVSAQSTTFNFVPGGSSIDRQVSLCVGCMSFEGLNLRFEELKSLR
jgi:hypothetical protein